MLPVVQAAALLLILQTPQADAAQASLVRGHMQPSQREQVSRAMSLLHQVEDIARSGTALPTDKVTEILNIVNEELIKDLQATRAEASARVTTNLASIDTCNAQAIQRNTEIKQSSEVSVGEARDAHQNCRVEEKTKHGNSNGRCGELDTYLGTINKPTNLPTSRPRAGMVDYVQTMSNYFCPKGPEVTRLDTACTEAEGDRATHKAQCDRNQATFESRFCTWRTQRVDTCVALQECHQGAHGAYTTHVTATTELVKKWKVEWSALQKIICYMNVWLKDGDAGSIDASHYETCDNHTPDTSGMEIDFGTAAPQAACPLTDVANYPGTPGFVTAEYSDVSDFAVEAIPCVGSPAPPPSLVETSRRIAASVDADGTVRAAKVY